MDNKPSPVSRLKDFQMIAGDVLKLIAELSKSKYPNDVKTSAIIESFYDQCYSIISNQGLDVQVARLHATTEHVKAIAFQSELKGLYNDLYKHDPKLATEFINKSYVPTKKDLDAAPMITPIKRPDSER